eukprot:scaffold40043_cov15-Prasinocladus_malaysianus.AAC.1
MCGCISAIADMCQSQSKCYSIAFPSGRKDDGLRLGAGVLDAGWVGVGQRALWVKARAGRLEALPPGGMMAGFRSSLLLLLLLTS